jgi:hypothetical protein
VTPRWVRRLAALALGAAVGSGILALGSRTEAVGSRILALGAREPRANSEAAPESHSPEHQSQRPYLPDGGPGALVGEVVDAATGRGIARAVVTLVAVNGGRSERSLADDRGRYYFKSLPPGDYAILAERPGYLAGAYGRGRPGGDATTIFVTTGRVTAGARIDMWRPGSLGGVVVDESNDPMVGARVEAHRQVMAGIHTRLEPAGHAVTDDRGAFRISGLVPGDYVVRVPQTRVGMAVSTFEGIANTGRSTGEYLWLLLASGLSPGSGAAALDANMDIDRGRDRFDLTYRYLTPPPPRDGRPRTYGTLFYPGTDQSSTAGTVSVEAGSHHAGVHFQMRPVDVGRLTGVVVGPDGPVDSLLLRLFPIPETSLEPGFETSVTVTAPDGSFSFGDVPVGSYTIEGRSATNLRRATPDTALEAAGFSVESQAPPDRGPLTDRAALYARTTARVTAEPGEPMVILAAPGDTTRGRVVYAGYGEPPAGAHERLRIELEPLEPGGPRAPVGFVEPSGSFEVTGVPPAQYYVRASGLPPGWHVASILSGTRDLSESPLAIGIETPSPITVTLSNQLGSLTGMIRDGQGRGQPHATVVVFPARLTTAARANVLRFRSARANADGVYRLEGLPDGMYSIAALPESAAANWREPRRLEELRSRATTISVRARQPMLVDVRIGR